MGNLKFPEIESTFHSVFHLQDSFEYLTHLIANLDYRLFLLPPLYFQPAVG